MCVIECVCVLAFVCVCMRKRMCVLFECVLECVYVCIIECMCVCMCVCVRTKKKILILDILYERTLNIE